MFAKSTDGGVSFGAPQPVATNLPSTGGFRLKNADPNFGSVPGAGSRSNSFPTAAIAPDGTIFVAWADFPNGFCTPDGAGRPPCVNADVRLSKSSDGGVTWSVPVRVNDDSTSNDQFFPWIATRPDGRLHVIWQGKRADPSNQNFDTFYANSNNGTSRRTCASPPARW